MKISGDNKELAIKLDRTCLVNMVDNQFGFTLPLSDAVDAVGQMGYSLEKLPEPGSEPEPEPDPGPIYSSSARSLAIELSKKPNFLVGLSGNVNDILSQGIKPDIYYRYLTGYGSSGWRGWNAPDGYYVDKVIKDAAASGSIPMFTYYQLALEAERKDLSILTSSNMHQYLKDLKLMFERMAVFNIPVLFHLEPDLFGYLQSLGVPLDTKVNLHYADFEDLNDFPETILGLMWGIVDMGKRIAPKCKIGFHVSQWGDWFSWTDPDANLIKHAFSVADYVRQFGPCDFITLEVSDRDAGFYEVLGKEDKYWDETNTVLPNYENYIQWASAVIDRRKKPGLLWQLPLGVPSSTPGGITGHYRDNRVHFFFNNVQYLIDIGAFGMVFGAGAAGQTIISTDGFQYRDASAKYNANPVEILGDGPTPDPDPDPVPVPGTGSINIGPDMKLQIHTIGDSITENPGWRTTIYNELKNYGIETDFIGTLNDKYPKSPEPEHDGHSGWTTRQVLKNLDIWFGNILEPELTIVVLGTNDVAWWMAEQVSDVAVRLNMIIDKIKANAPNGTVLVASIPPQKSKIIENVKIDRAELVVAYNKEVALLVDKRKGEKVHFVDIFSALTLDDLYDGIHPSTAEGHVKMGMAFFAEIVRLLP